MTVIGQRNPSRRKNSRSASERGRAIVELLRGSAG
jgi:hypothetical protein